MKFLYIINKRYKRKQKGTASVDFGVCGSGRSTGSYLGWSLFTFKIFGFTLLSEVRPTVASGDDERAVTVEFLTANGGYTICTGTNSVARAFELGPTVDV